MATRRSDVVVTRGGIGALASLIGFGGVISAVVLLVWQGNITLPVIIACIVGIVGMVAWARVQPDDFRAFMRGRAIQHGTATILGAVLLTGIIVMVYLLTARASLTWDLTLNQRFSLSQTSLDVIRRVSRPMQITGFYTSRALGLREIDDQYWRLYEQASNGVIRRVYYDPEATPALAQQFGVTEDPQVFLSYLNPDGSVDFSLVSRVFLTNTQEQDMTNAISRLLVAGSITVYFDTSLGERDPLDASQEGISGINNGMRESGLITYPLDLASLAANGGEIPRDASAVIFARPLTDFTSQESAVVQRYLENGGSLLLLSDVLFNDDPFLTQNGEFNNYLWQNYGVRALDAAVVDYAAGQNTPLDFTGTALFEEQAELAANLSQNAPLFRLARAVDVNLDFANPDLVNGRLIMSSGQSYGETDWARLGQTNTYEYDPAADLSGPLSLVVWAHNQRNNSRIVLIGDSDFVSNGQVLSSGDIAVLGNGILFTNVMSWLTRLNEVVSFGTQAYSANVPLFFTRQQRDLIFFVTVFLIPGAVLVTGMTIWARRVRR